MAKKSNHFFKKNQKELKRKKKAIEKMNRRQGKNDNTFNDIQEQNNSN
jgi:hypothetical protein